MVLAAYALVTAGAALLTGRYTMLLFAALCALSFGTLAGASLAQALAARQASRRARVAPSAQTVPPVPTPMIYTLRLSSTGSP